MSLSPLAKILEIYGSKMSHPGQWWVHHKLLRLFGIKVDQAQRVRRGGLEWELNPSDYVQSDVFWLGAKDKWDVAHILKLAKSDWTVLDCGANFGYYSLKIAQHLERECNVFAFEPCADTYARLVKHIEMNQMSTCITAVDMGVSNVIGKGALVNDPNNSGGNSISMEEGDIPLTTIDQFCADRDITHVDFIKLDIEGCEEGALKGGEAIISQSRPYLYVELNPRTLARMGSSVEAVTERIANLGYELFETNRKKLVPVTELPVAGEMKNVFCYPKQ